MFTMEDIIYEGHPGLRVVAEEVTFPMDEKLKETALKMLEFIRNSQDEETAEKYQLRPGVGLAAPQINVNKRIFAVLLYEYDEEGNKVGEILNEIFVNPVLTRHSVQQAALEAGEGCLSVNREVPGYVPRSARVTIEYQDLEGNPHSIKLRNYEAIVAQHELDHLNGVMFYDHINEEEPWAQPDDLKLI